MSAAAYRRDRFPIPDAAPLKPCSILPPPTIYSLSRMGRAGTPLPVPLKTIIAMWRDGGSCKPNNEATSYKKTTIPPRATEQKASLTGYRFFQCATAPWKGVTLLVAKDRGSYKETLAARREEVLWPSLP